MTEPRIIQNFLGYRAFVVSEAPANEPTVAAISVNFFINALLTVLLGHTTSGIGNCCSAIDKTLKRTQFGARHGVLGGVWPRMPRRRRGVRARSGKPQGR